MMDEYLEQYFSSSSWSDVNAKERSSWDYSEQQNELLPVSLGICEGGGKSSPVSIANANHTMENLTGHDTSSIVLGGESDYSINKNLLGEVQPQKDYQNCNLNNLSSDGKINGSLKLGNLSLQYDTAIPSLGSVNRGSPKQFPLPSDIASPLSHIELGHVGGNGTELFETQKPLRDLQTLSPVPELWLPPSYEEVSSFSSLMGQDRNQGFGVQGVKLTDSDTIGNGYVGMHKILQFDSLSTPVNMKGKQELQNHSLSSFAAGPQMTMSTPGFQSLQQTITTGSCNGNGKPRVRARRGQATDPHSIAERLRREKIAERMKNLQELVPNSNKTDKASMLDEIIDYVKFLQLQVKVLSMSRLGAAGAVLPLITDGQAEGSNCLALSPPAVQGVDMSSNPDQVALEEEVVKMMESNVTMAMQYLQSKGLCLMPIALAAAISSGKASSSGTASEERNKFGFSNTVVQNNSSSSSSNSSLPSDGIGMQQMSPDGNIIIGKPIREAVALNGCNGTLKQELMNTFSTTRELKPRI